MDPPTASPTTTASSKGKVFAARLTSTLILWGVMAAAFIWRNDWIIAALIAFFGIASAVEYFRLFRGDKGARAFGWLGMVISIAYWLLVLFHFHAPPFWLDVAAVIAAVQGAFLLSYRHALEGEHTLNHIFATVFGVLYTAVMFGFMSRLFFWPGGNGLTLVLFVVMVTKFCDSGAYAVGVLFGRHKMIPHISPAKSWEGFVGAFLGGFAAAVTMLLLAPDKLAPLTWTHGLILVPILCLVGITGDLAESVLKRCTHIKDSGHALPGIGGILDLTDSLLFTAPVFYLYLVAIS